MAGNVYEMTHAGLQRKFDGFIWIEAVIREKWEELVVGRNVSPPIPVVCEHLRQRGHMRGCTG